MECEPEKLAFCCLLMKVDLSKRSTSPPLAAAIALRWLAVAVAPAFSYSFRSIIVIFTWLLYLDIAGCSTVVSKLQQREMTERLSPDVILLVVAAKFIASTRVYSFGRD